MSDETGADQLPFTESRRVKNVNPELYRHTIEDRVRNFECDRQGIVHNVAYMYWLEKARIEYFRAAGLRIDGNTFITDHHFVVAHTETDYLSAASFDNPYEVLTRVVALGTSSFRMRQVVRCSNSRTVLIAEAVLVHLNPHTRRPEELPTAFRTLICRYEGRIDEKSEWDYTE